MTVIQDDVCDCLCAWVCACVARSVWTLACVTQIGNSSACKIRRDVYGSWRL